MIVGALLIAEGPSRSLGFTEPVKEAQVDVNGKKIQVEIADTQDKRSLGLSLRDSLPKDHGMLFIFDDEGIYSFWMKNMEFNLDIIWINSAGTVVHVEKNLKPCLEICPSYESEKPARYVLEVNSGVSDELGIREGATVKIIFNN
ncbi:MAG: DUF192 domain-containing protein [Thaumarchaeota archaeon]|nr:DUF192 domain-containing protein [Nitrososphaerota archaeon]MCL5317405.1 DUF192 domain-containing protein [Nitrososphaerota archaeon]